MKNKGPIIVIEDDIDDQELIAETFNALNYDNQIIYFSDGYKALKFLENGDTEPFLILSDINMPRINGFELREKVQNSEKLKVRCIPYVFFTTGAQREAVEDAYSRSAQGFFVKPSSIREFQNVIRKIVDYWKQCYYSDEVSVQPVQNPNGTVIPMTKKRLS